MKKSILYRTNIFVCVVIIIGFIAASIIGYYSNQNSYEQNVQRVSDLTSQGIYHEIDSIFRKPIHISATMANDVLLKECLTDGSEQQTPESFQLKIQDYLLSYKEHFTYDSVFLISTKNNYYYHFNGVGRTLSAEQKENKWYYDFLTSNSEYAFNIDNDEALDNDMTVFLNYKIRGKDNDILGVVGIGFQITQFQKLLQSYEEKFGVHSYLVDGEGIIKISANSSEIGQKNLFQSEVYSDIKKELLLNEKGSQNFWHSSTIQKQYIVSKYIADLEWYLVIDNNAAPLQRDLRTQLFIGILVLAVVVIIVLLIITSIIKRYNVELIHLAVTKEQERKLIFQQATEQLYEDIYEVNITHNHLANEAAKNFFSELGALSDITYDDALRFFAQKFVKKEFQDEYYNMFCTDHILQTFANNTDHLSYDLEFTSDGENYSWMRIIARIFYWDEDSSIRMFVYRQNIDIQKQQEEHLLEQMQLDTLSGLYNKSATQNHIQELLRKQQGSLFAFFIFDIDNFKNVNDTYGHIVGDTVIVDFSKRLKSRFRNSDIIGRIGGDEFVAFLPIPSVEWVSKKAAALTFELSYQSHHAEKSCDISVSIGVSIAPNVGDNFEALYKKADLALYETKRNGKNGFTIYKGN